MSTQWNVGPGGLVGLNYHALEFVFNLYGIEKRREVFEDIRILEAAALEALREK